jgi:catechol 2,3-dioxygenase-like lactoylglutathione lyase family enzyme
MNLNHVHLAGPEVRALRSFYETWFGFRMLAEHGDGMFLVNDAGFLLAIDPIPAPAVFPAWFHLGFCLGDPGTVVDLHDRMRSAGVRIVRDLLREEGAYASYYCADPAGTKIEVSWHAD